MKELSNKKSKRFFTWLFASIVVYYRCYIYRTLTAEKIYGEKEETFFVCVDLENTFDQVPIVVVKWTMRKLGVYEWLIRAVTAMYRNSNSLIRVNNTVGDHFDVKLGIRQGSVLSPLLFVVVLEALKRGYRTTLPWELLYANDSAIMIESLEELDTCYATWKHCME